MMLIKNWGFRMVLLYAGFVILMISLALIATNNSNDLVAVNYYDQEIAYESQIQKIRSTKALKEPLRWTLEGRMLSLHFPSMTPKGKIILYRASDARQDRIIPISVDGNGRQRIDLSTASSGTWRMMVDWEIGTLACYDEESIFIDR